MWILSTRDALAEVVGSVEQPVALLPQGDRFDELDWLLWAFDRVSPGVAAGFAPLGVSRDGRSILYEVPPEVASALEFRAVGQGQGRKRQHLPAS